MVRHHRKSAEQAAMLRGDEAYSVECCCVERYSVERGSVQAHSVARWPAGYLYFAGCSRPLGGVALPLRCGGRGFKSGRQNLFYHFRISDHNAVTEGI